ncbi:MAG: ClC family H(+)/Cl(-) exchange transporter [Propionibacteriaceae bacterium]|jgi:H+/Cl- antiporter ClcA|nr:ClC family H(+)/Cl(-) exchange transporter [Propionibacteriaceae bacterium]
MRVTTIPLLAKSLVVGVLTGVVVSGYRWLLGTIEHGSSQAYAFIGQALGYLPLLVVGLAVLAVALGWLGKRYPLIGGSGIPAVVAIVQGRLRDTWVSTLVAKFVGGAGAMASGLALGREGPCIQMGACIGDGMGRHFSKQEPEKMMLIAGGASAGLSAAFGAPLAGTIFAFEEIFKKLDPLTLMATTLAAVASDYVTALLLGTEPIFDLTVPVALPLNAYWMLLVLGVALGLIGASYNRLLVWLKGWYQRVSERWAIFRPIPVMLLAVPVGLCFPAALGSGQRALDSLLPTASLGFLALLLAVRFVFSIVSFSGSLPGGILFPLLILGGITGAITANVAITWFGIDASGFDGFIIVAMAGCFAAIVRAPITGIVLLLEMTGSFVHLLPLTLVCITAYITAELLHTQPVYTALLEADFPTPATPGSDAAVQ